MRNVFSIRGHSSYSNHFFYLWVHTQCEQRVIMLFKIVLGGYAFSQEENGAVPQVNFYNTVYFCRCKFLILFDIHHK